MPAPLIECIPNFSEGRDPEKIAAIADAITNTKGAKLLHIDTSPAAHRTVMTIAGAPEAVVHAAFAAIAKAAKVIDMSAQEGVHPRIGATDVCPLVPLRGMTMADADTCAKVLGERVGTELEIPVYLYEHSAMSDHRRALPDIRKGQYEGFAEKMLLPEWAPDYGPSSFNKSAGATVIGARDVLVAFNISLDTVDVAIAKKIAARIRSSGYWQRDKAGNRTHHEGWLGKTRAIGWYMEDYQQAQVSINLLDYKLSGPLQVYEICEQLAREYGVAIAGSELIGLMPEACLLQAGAAAMLGAPTSVHEDHSLLVQAGINKLGLDKLKPFKPQEKVLEYALVAAGL